MAYQEWGDPGNPEVVLCVHGLTRTGRDFDALARHLSERFRVVCPDVVGRGLSDWLSNPAFYAVPQYLSDMVTLVARLQPRRLHWVGTSMGGLIGMLYAGAIAQLRTRSVARTPAQSHLHLPDSHLRLDSIVLNDVGPHIEIAALERIGQYVGEAVSFGSFDEALAYVKTTCASFGPHSEEHWADLACHTYVEQHGRWVKHYDLRIASVFQNLTPDLNAQAEAVLWNAYSSIDIPVQIVRGAESDLLSEQTLQQMVQTHDRVEAAQIPGVGHAPTLMVPEQIALVSRFLLSQTDQTL